jgi:hypothetical protein
VAGWVTGSANVRLVRVKLVAVAAQAGADGVAASNYDTALQQNDPKIAGKPATGATGGAAQACAMLCTNNVPSSGGKGGNGAPPSAGDGGVDGGSDAGAPTGGTNGGPPIAPPDPPTNTGAGGIRNREWSTVLPAFVVPMPPRSLAAQGPASLAR